jgi:hypothetical protein
MQDDIIEIPPFRAKMLIKADFRCEIKNETYGSIKTLWKEPVEGNTERYFIVPNLNSSILTISELLEWLDDVLRLEPHLYTCYDDVDILRLKEDLMSFI